MLTPYDGHEGTVSRRTVFGIVAVLAGLAVALSVYLHGRPSGEVAPVDTTEPEATEARASLADPRQAPSPKGTAPVLDRKRADEMRERLRALFAEAGPGWGAGEPDPAAAQPRTGFAEMPAPAGSGNQAQGEQGKYIRSVIREQFFPLARQCYDSARIKHPGLAGKIELEFRIVGDKRVGGVVDQASLGDGGDLRDDAFSQCMTESMMSVTFDAPPRGGEVTVKYPFEFSPDDPDGGD